MLSSVGTLALVGLSICGIKLVPVVHNINSAVAVRYQKINAAPRQNGLALSKQALFKVTFFLNQD